MLQIAVESNPKEAASTIQAAFTICPETEKVVEKIIVPVDTEPEGLGTPPWVPPDFPQFPIFTPVTPVTEAPRKK
jgi:hypothetical protein